MLYAEDIALTAESEEEMRELLQKWKDKMEAKWLRKHRKDEGNTDSSRIWATGKSCEVALLYVSKKHYNRFNTMSELWAMVSQEMQWYKEQEQGKLICVRGPHGGKIEANKSLSGQWSQQFKWSKEKTRVGARGQIERWELERKNLTWATMESWNMLTCSVISATSLARVEGLRMHHGQESGAHGESLKRCIQYWLKGRFSQAERKDTWHVRKV